MHGSNWTEALAAGWPIFEVIALVAELYGATGGQALPEDCQPLTAELWGLEQHVATGGLDLRARAEPLLQSSCALARACGAAALAAADATWLARSQAAARMAVAAGPQVGHPAAGHGARGHLRPALPHAAAARGRSAEAPAAPEHAQGAAGASGGLSFWALAISAP